MRTKLAKVNTWRPRKPPLMAGAGLLVGPRRAVAVAAVAPAATAQPAAKAGGSGSLSITKQSSAAPRSRTPAR